MVILIAGKWLSAIWLIVWVQVLTARQIKQISLYHTSEWSLPIFCMKSAKALPLLMQNVPSLRLFLDCISEFPLGYSDRDQEICLMFDGEIRAREGGMVIFPSLL